MVIYGIYGIYGIAQSFRFKFKEYTEQHNFLLFFKFNFKKLFSFNFSETFRMSRGWLVVFISFIFQLFFKIALKLTLIKDRSVAPT